MTGEKTKPIKANSRDIYATEGSEGTERGWKSLLISWLVVLSISVVSVISVANRKVKKQSQFVKCLD